MTTATPFLDAVAARRSNYTLTKESPIPNTRILEIVNHALKYAPSPFNVRSTRAIVLFGTAHTKLWQNAYQVTEAQTPESITFLGPRIQSFEASHGTILWFDDASALDLLSPRFKNLSLQYPDWQEHSMGIHQFIVWTALNAEGFGVNLQHYHPSITPYVNETFDVPETWTLKAQLVFGWPSEGPGVEKPKTHLEESLRVFGE